MFEMFGKKRPENWVDPDPLDMTWEHEKASDAYYDFLDDSKTLHSASENSACHPEFPEADRRD